jgi:hypothetical protein
MTAKYSEKSGKQRPQPLFVRIKKCKANHNKLFHKGEMIYDKHCFCCNQRDSDDPRIFHGCEALYGSQQPGQKQKTLNSIFESEKEKHLWI